MLEVNAHIKILAAYFLIALVLCSIAPAQAVRPDFSGTWTLDKARIVGDAPWGQTYAEHWNIRQSGTELTLTVNDDVYRLTLDGVVRLVVDNSLGPIPNSVRKTETVAEWNNSKLTLKVTEINERTDPRTGKVEIVPGITNVNILSILPDGTELTVERTGYRAQPPNVLHGRPYQKSDDFAYRQQTVVYVRTAG